MAGGQALTGGYLCGVRFELTAVEPEGIARRTRDYDGTGLPSALRNCETRPAAQSHPRRGNCSPNSKSIDWSVDDPINVQNRIARSARWIAPNRRERVIAFDRLERAEHPEFEQASSLACVGGR
jgi:hypothetical protein